MHGWIRGLVVAIGVTAMAGSAGATDLVVYSAAAMKAAMESVAAEFTAATGEHVRFVFGTAGVVRDRVAAGEAVDLVIAPPAPLKDLAARGFVVADSIKGLGETKLGVGVRRGWPHPKLATEADIQTMLLAAPSIGMPDPSTGATTGVYLAKLFEKMGLAEVLKPKLRLYPDGLQAMEAGARGDVALGLGQISEILPVAGVELAGVLPDSLQLRTVYAVSRSSHSGNPAAAQRLYEFLTNSARAPGMVKFGFVAPSP